METFAVAKLSKVATTLSNSALAFEGIVANR